MMLVFWLACAPAPLAPDAVPFAGVLAALDRDHDGSVAVAEYPAHPPGGAVATIVDRDHDGKISAPEVRDEVYAVDPASFDRMAWKHGAVGGQTATSDLPPPGPLAEALRFLADLAVARNPSAVPPSEAEIAAAAAAGMRSPPGDVVLARFASAGLDIPSTLAVAAGDPASLPLAKPVGPQTVGRKPTLRSAGPGGAAALRVPSHAPR